MNKAVTKMQAEREANTTKLLSADFARQPFTSTDVSKYLKVSAHHAQVLLIELRDRGVITSVFDGQQYRYRLASRGTIHFVKRDNGIPLGRYYPCAHIDHGSYLDGLRFGEMA